MTLRGADERRSGSTALGALATLIAGLLMVLWTAGPAIADTIDDAITALKSGAIYVASGAQNGYGKTVSVDTSQVSTAAGSSVKIAILPEGQATETVAAQRFAPALESQGSIVIAVFSGNKFYAGSTALQSGLANTRLQSVVSANSTALKNGDYTSTLVAYATTMRGIIAQSTTSDTGNSGSGDTNSSSKSGSSAWPWLVGIGGLAVVGGGGFVWSRKRKAQRELDSAKANVMPYYDRLANEVNTINTKDNATAQQAMADASERFTAAGSQMASATTVQNWAIARRTVLEGLQASQLARKELGLPPGPELPPVDEARGEQLTSAKTVDVNGQQYQGYPQYTPGAPYYFGGGGGYPGGWYSFPFWETLLIGSMLGGGFGGWGFGGGGYGAGYDSGYDAGRDAAQNDQGGGGWGGSGDFGGGGFGGGGDFGGGGFGGGGSDGGSF